MSVRKSSIVWLVLGVVLITLAVVVRFVVLPSASKLPTDTDQSQLFEGSLSALDAEAFAAGDLGELMTPEAPITADRSVKVDASEGDTAIVTVKAVLHLPGDVTQNDVHTYAVDRGDLGPVELSQEQQDSLVPEEQKATFERHEGVAFSWPIGPDKNGTALYDSVTQTAQEAAFVDEGTLEGRDVYNYRVDAEGPITSPSALAGFAQFPKQLPKSAVAGLLQAGVVPEANREVLQSNLDQLPEMLDVGFYSTNKVDAAVDQQFGVPLRFDQEQSMFAAVTVNGQQVSVLPLSTVKLHTSDADVKSGADTAAKNGLLLSVMGIWVPIALVVIGIALIVLAVVRWRKPVTAEHVAARSAGEPSRL